MISVVQSPESAELRLIAHRTEPLAASVVKVSVATAVAFPPAQLNRRVTLTCRAVVGGHAEVSVPSLAVTVVPVTVQLLSCSPEPGAISRPPTVSSAPVLASRHTSKKKSVER